MCGFTVSSVPGHSLWVVHWFHLLWLDFLPKTCISSVFPYTQPLSVLRLKLQRRARYQQCQPSQIACGLRIVTSLVSVDSPYSRVDCLESCKLSKALIVEEKKKTGPLWCWETSFPPVHTFIGPFLYCKSKISRKTGCPTFSESWCTSRLFFSKWHCFSSPLHSEYGKTPPNRPVLHDQSIWFSVYVHFL